MNRKQVKYVLDFFTEYGIANTLDRSTLESCLLQVPTNGTGITNLLKVNSAYFSHECSRKIPQHIKELIKISGCSWIYSIVLHFDVCPVCGNKKKYLTGTTCSTSCANSFFNTGSDRGKPSENHRTVCFAWHKKECIICLESNIVEVHHYDENHLNNDPSNLVPLCPTHHQYWHSSFKYLVEPKITEYVNKIKNDF